MLGSAPHEFRDDYLPHDAGAAAGDASSSASVRVAEPGPFPLRSPAGGAPSTTWRRQSSAPSRRSSPERGRRRSPGPRSRSGSAPSSSSRASRSACSRGPRRSRRSSTASAASRSRRPRSLKCSRTRISSTTGPAPSRSSSTTPRRARPARLPRQGRAHPEGILAASSRSSRPGTTLSRSRCARSCRRCSRATPWSSSRSEVTPRSGALVTSLFDGLLPDGVLAVAQGGSDIGAALVGAGVDLVVFTGSVATGKKIAVACAEPSIPTSLELGGKDSAIVLGDAIWSAPRAASSGAPSRTPDRTAPPSSASMSSRRSPTASSRASSSSRGSSGPASTSA